MAKIQRKYLAHYLEVTDGTWVRLGKDLEEFSPELSAQIEKTKNILGETSVNLVGYEKTAAVEPYYAENGDPLFEKLQEILDSGLTQDDCRVSVVEVKLWDGKTEAGYPAVKEECVLEITSYGGDTQGYRIPFTLHYTGVREIGSFDVVTRTFTA